MNEYSPIVSEFESAEQEASYLAWLSAKVAEARADKRPKVAHDVVMAEMREIIAKASAQS
jgi:hypothetical protein